MFINVTGNALWAFRLQNNKYIGYGLLSIVCTSSKIVSYNVWNLCFNKMSNKTPRVGTIGWGSCLMKRRSLVRISPFPSALGQKLIIKKKKEKKFEH
jgi:hypothetical protein